MQRDQLVVFDRLTVGPVKVEKNRLTAPYRLFWDGKEESVDLVYKYEEDVFEPNDRTALNLASMAAVQVALNYGLFCRELELRGNFDETDRKFLADMLENTAREIYVKKFLEPNPFLMGEAAQLPVEKGEPYTAARLEFPDISTPSTKTRWALWTTDRRRHAILSSGGKDSLLTYGLLDELGLDVHPLYVNESGRHWFTALNAYKHFNETIPNTGRVWTNSDRVFNWMLRRMPFIRQDFANVRSDEYPVRLWTVAVFLFGVLPLVRKRGIARVLIGDEYDTTRRVSYKGIPHYDGLYDQSRYFDNAMSRYYLRKGFACSQFSILRPMSELLIEKTLAHRYPHLLRHQVSCHAAHKEEERIRPCGRCEKCRRIVGMLSAVDVDPGMCGYTQQQINDCLKNVETMDIHQESAGASHMRFLLKEKGVLAFGKKKIQPRPEVLKLRFDQERSPLDGMPVDLRPLLLGILLEHADGALVKSGRQWKEFDPLADPVLRRPFPFEQVPRIQKRQSFMWGEMTWPEAEERFKEVDIALLPVGSIEQHGPHLPLDTDAFDAEYLAHKVAEACSQPQPLVLPAIPYGISYEHSGFKGTIDIQNHTLSNLIFDIGVSVAKNGIRKLVIINGHGGNVPALNYAAQMINREAGIFVCVDSGETSDVDIYKIIDGPNDVHAGEIETSTSLAVRPHLVKMDLASRSVPEFSSRYLNFTSRRGVLWYSHTQKFSTNGVIGDATKATVEKGREIWQIMIAHLVSLVEDLKNLTPDEIFNRRY